MDDLQDELLFLEEDAESEEAQPADNWKILIVDDEEEIHQVTRLALSKFRFEDKKLDIYSAYSGQEARKLLNRYPDLAMVLLDVVMETEDAGLEVVNYIRNEMENRLLRIVLRTGQPGIAPEEFVINNYDIDDYKSKTELTAQKLQTTLIASLRAYRELKRIEDIVEARTNELAERNRDMMDSIRYAKRIQTAILPDAATIDKYFPDSFIFFQPKDIVSGDFYWFSNHGHFSVVADIDCTGHGVPGALMSIIGYNLLTRIVREMEVFEPEKMLNQLDLLVKEFLKQEEENVVVRDSMDMGLCVVNSHKKALYYAGANRPMYLLSGKELVEFGGERNPVGDTLIEQKNFSQHEYHYKPGDRIYLFSDGFTDQFGGERGKKYTNKRFKEFLLGVQHLDMKQQLERVRTEFHKWMGNRKQLDDVSIVGVELS